MNNQQIFEFRDKIPKIVGNAILEALTIHKDELVESSSVHVEPTSFAYGVLNSDFITSLKRMLSTEVSFKKVSLKITAEAFLFLNSEYEEPEIICSISEKRINAMIQRSIAALKNDAESTLLALEMAILDISEEFITLKEALQDRRDKDKDELDSMFEKINGGIHDLISFTRKRQLEV